MNPQFSVIIPSYNHARFLPAAIDSVLAQTLTDWEIVLVDDRSSDESFELAQSFDDVRIKVLLNERNSGTYATLNRALDEATGDWVAVLNSDDLWEPEKLAIQSNLLSRYDDAAWSYTNGGQLDADGVLSIDDRQDWPNSELQDVLPHLLQHNLILASSLVFRRGAVRFREDLRYCGDWVASLELAQQGPAAWSELPLTMWRQHDDNSYQKVAAVAPEEIEVREEILIRNIMLAEREDPMFRRNLARCALHLSSLYVLVGDAENSRRTNLLARQLDPSDPTAAKRSWLLRFGIPLSRKLLWPNLHDLALIERAYDARRGPP